MSVAFDAVSTLTYVNGATGNWSWTHTPSGTPTGVAIPVVIYPSGSITGVTYGGQTCTLANSISTNSEDCLIYGLANPPSGAQTVTISTTGFVYGQAGAITVTGGDTTTVFDATATNSDGGTRSASQSTTITGGSSSGLIVDCLMYDRGGTETVVVNGSQTQRINGTGTIYLESSTKAGGSSVTMAWTETDIGYWGHVLASFKPAGGAVIIPHFTLLGVGV